MENVKLSKSKTNWGLREFEKLFSPAMKVYNSSINGEDDLPTMVISLALILSGILIARAVFTHLSKEKFKNGGSGPALWSCSGCGDDVVMQIMQDGGNLKINSQVE